MQTQTEGHHHYQRLMAHFLIDIDNAIWFWFVMTHRHRRHQHSKTQKQAQQIPSSSCFFFPPISSFTSLPLTATHCMLHHTLIDHTRTTPQASFTHHHHRHHHHTSSFHQPGLHIHALPDPALEAIAAHLKSLDLIKGLQLADKWALSTFAKQTKDVILWSKPLLEQEEEEEESLGNWATLLPARGEATPEGERYKQLLRKHATVLSSFLSRFPQLNTLHADNKDPNIVPVLVEVFTQKRFPTIHTCAWVLVCGMKKMRNEDYDEDDDNEHEVVILQ
jgi:hypothetical protein